jgi:hypothetical protein
VTIGMARLPTSGATVASPCRAKDELKDVLGQLGIREILSDGEVSKLYGRFGIVIGKWLAEQYRLEISPVAKALLSMGQNLAEIAATLDAINTGFRAHFDIEVAHLLAQYLAHDPTVGSLDAAKDLLASLQMHAAQVGHASLVAHADLLTQSGEPGRPRLDWYDDFTALLLDLADKGRVKPQLQKNRITGIRSGWLLDAAQALESFLYPAMRSQSSEACGKRLERGKRRLEQRQGQKRSRS